jgi:hypothetical protein
MDMSVRTLVSVAWRSVATFALFRAVIAITAAALWHMRTTHRSAPALDLGRPSLLRDVKAVK